ncbi:pyrroline-5-carboxylate reductase [Flavobacterium aurantiibacter]|uniref:Pyrroline-5-carboxylate reductase n=1 Tax=Flavobacterium aurantiibacter TaxID=2023067 RepID=A0A255ZX59_9FLAO|nr:pyrroline-5-carboxylate reductase [Flavobacterium aurantiibacter]OYQ45370.1 pyrroline-5-carboxylate reductase [Flavobacterium aurantiibacter]
MNILIVGGGNLGTAIAIGLRNAYPTHTITVTRRDIAKIAYLHDRGIATATDSKQFATSADLIILTIKPHQAEAVIENLMPFSTNTIIASAVSGLSLERLQALTQNTKNVVRIMPNIAAQFNASATCIAAGEPAREAANVVSELFSALGTAPKIEEKLMDAATVLGACGTAYALRYIRASMQAGIEIGFDAQTALAIAAQTVKGAAELLMQEKVHPEQLIDRVTTPQGCTIVGLNEMEHEGFSSSLIKGIKTSLKQIKG